jgi:hypothetical protein
MRTLLAAALVLGVCLSAFAQAQQHATESASLANLSPAELLQCFSELNKCGAASNWELADVLGKSSNKAFLFSEFQRSRDQQQQLGIIYALYRIDDPEVDAFFRKLVAGRFDDGEDLYYPLNYLAKRCDSAALGVLSGRGKGDYKGYPGCLQWTTTVELFGKCKYSPAIPYLIRSINAACMNIGIAAVDDLRAMFPGSPDFKNYSPEEIQHYFRSRAAAAK